MIKKHTDRSAEEVLKMVTEMQTLRIQKLEEVAQRYADVFDRLSEHLSTVADNIEILQINIETLEDRMDKLSDWYPTIFGPNAMTH